MQNLIRFTICACLFTFSFFFLSETVKAVPPSPELEAQLAVGKKPIPYYLENFDQIHQKGVCQPEHVYLKPHPERSGAQLSAAAGPFRVLAILVKFSDHDSSVAATFFDSLVFSSNGSTVKSYFSEISYTQIDLITLNNPSSLGWRTAPQTYGYYTNNQNGLGSYPQNTQKLVEDMVDQVDPFVNFAQYDNDGDGKVDCLLLIHSGTGAEFSGSDDDIWSHKWGITPRAKDGVTVSSYTAQPEFWSLPGDMTIGVYSHELLHGFGLPDLYDTKQITTNNGIGKWCVMAHGCWNGPGSRGGSPAHPCAWSRIELGFATATNVTSNMSGTVIDNVNQNGTIYRLWNSGNIGPEYFLVENRQQIGFDTFLPNDGLLIWHIDDNKSNNQQEWYPGQPGANHFLVALEQADGSFELEHRTNLGNSNDPFPGTTNNTDFDALSSPNSDSYTSGPSFVAVQNITPSGQEIIADLIVGFSAGIGDDPVLPAAFDLSQNFPNPFNPNTTIGFSLPVSSNVRVEIFNLMGELTAVLADTRYSAGTHSVIWDGRGKSGDEVASGIYFYRLLTDDETLSKKMVLVR